MSKQCEICGKKSIKAAKLTFSHKQIVHTQEPNLQSVKVNMNGTVKRIKVCTSCLRAGKVTKAVQRERAEGEVCQQNGKAIADNNRRPVKRERVRSASEINKKKNGLNAVLFFIPEVIPTILHFLRMLWIP